MSETPGKSLRQTSMFRLASVLLSAPLLLGCGGAEGSGNGGPTSPVPPPDASGTWGRTVVTLEASGVSGNPFEVIVDGVFTHGASGTEIRMPGYYDGNDTWRVKFMPPRAGEWSYRTESPVAALDGVTGTVTVDPSSRRGMLMADPARPTKWQFADGTHVLPIELRLEFFSEPGTLSEFEAAADALAQGGALMMDTRLTEEQGMFEGGRHDFIFEGDWQNHRFDLEVWQRMDRRMEALAERGLGAHIMFYSDDGGAPGWNGQSETEQLVLRYAVARLAPYPVVLWNTAIDVAEVRSEADIDWMGQQLESLDPYDHPRSSRRGGGSGSIVMDNETFYSLGVPHSPEMQSLLRFMGQTPSLPVGFDDAWIENWSGGSRPNHTPSDIRRAGWKNLVAGGGAFIIRGGADGLSVDGGYYSLQTVESDWESEQWLSLVNPFLRNQLGQHWPDMTSAQSLADGTHIYALADPDRDRIVYLAVGANDSVDTGGGGSLTLVLSGESGSWNGTWFDPRDGSTSDAGAFDGGQDYTVSPPSDDDWILLLSNN